MLMVSRTRTKTGFYVTGALLSVMLMMLHATFPTTARDLAHAAASSQTDLPAVEIDALDDYRWSLTDIEVAPGQTIRITNRGAIPHGFSVDEWNVDETIPSLATANVTVPNDLQPGQQFTFYCNEPGHAALGQTGTITIVTEDTARNSQQNASAPSNERIVLETGDDFSWSLASFEAEAGQFIEVRNPGVLEHHFVVDEWDINETISAGEVKLVQVPSDARPGQQFLFYCSVPGHRAGGMEGTITIVDGDRGRQSPRRSEADLSQFLPTADALGDGWSLVRTGNARAVLSDYDNASTRVFPGEGRGATYIGPQGSRATVIVLPFSTTDAPTNQIEDAVLAVQLMLMNEWEADLRLGSTLNSIAPPTGCDFANRASGVTRVYTLPAGSTVCQLRSVGVAIFVAIEGQYGNWIGVEAADEIVAKVLQRAAITPVVVQQYPPIGTK